MFKTKTTFTMLMTVVFMWGAFSVAGDLIVIIKKSLDERVSDLERKCAMYDAYFAENRINLVDRYGDHIIIITEDQSNSFRGNCNMNGNVNPRNQGRYMVTFKDGSKLVAVTFEKTKSYVEDFNKGRIKVESYVFYLENGQKEKCSIKNVIDIVFMPYNKER